MSKGSEASTRVVFALTSPTKVQARTFSKIKAEERIKKKKAKKEPSLNLDSQPQKHPIKKDMARPGNQTIGLFLDSRYWVVLYKGQYCMDGGNPIESCQPSNTRGSGSWLHTVDWIKNSNGEIQETCTVLWHYDGILSL